jgi:hypothetical protein
MWVEMGHSLGAWALVGGFALVTIAMLVTGKTFNPIRGATPWLVTREGQPGRYWAGIAFCAFLTGVLAWVIFIRAS